MRMHAFCAVLEFWNASGYSFHFIHPSMKDRESLQVLVSRIVPRARRDMLLTRPRQLTDTQSPLQPFWC